MRAIIRVYGSRTHYDEAGDAPANNRTPTIELQYMAIINRY